MEIIINQQPYTDINAYDEENENFTLSATLTSEDDASATEITKMFVKAALVEGYCLESIVQALHNVSEYEAFEHNITIKTEDE